MMVRQNYGIDLVAPDPLLHRFDLPLRKTFYPFGFPVDLQTNSEEVLAAAEESWGDSEQRFEKPAIPIRIGVSEEEQELPAPPVFRASGHLLTIVSDAANFAACDVSTGFSFCWLSRTAAAEHVWARYYFIEAIAYATITHLYLTAVHAACVARSGRGVLLCARSGMGKSVLAFACAKRGWTFVSDDVSSMVRERFDNTVVGRPERLKLLPSAAALFPEVDPLQRRVDQNGCPFIELQTNQFEIATARECPIDFVIFLQRPSAGPPRLLPVDAKQTFARLAAELPVFEESVHEAQLQSLRILAALPAMELQYTDLEDAVKMLDGLIKGGP